MRTERWTWLTLFFLVSICIHTGLAYRVRIQAMPRPPKIQEIEVALEPIKAVPAPKPVIPKPEPKPKEPSTISSSSRWWWASWTARARPE